MIAKLGKRVLPICLFYPLTISMQHCLSMRWNVINGDITKLINKSVILSIAQYSSERSNVTYYLQGLDNNPFTCPYAFEVTTVKSLI